MRWVNHGGRLVGWRYGAARLAYALGISHARYDAVPGNTDGPLVKVLLDKGSPLAEGVGGSAWAVVDTAAMRAPGTFSPVRFPTQRSGEFRVSGLRRSTHWLQGTTAVADEPVGRGRSVVFSFEPNFGGGTVGTQRILFNSILGPDPKHHGNADPVVFDPEAVARRIARTTTWVDEPEPDVH